MAYNDDLTFDPSKYLSSQSMGQDWGNYLKAGQQYGGAAQSAAQAKLQQLMYGANYGRNQMINSVSGRGQGRSLVFGGAGTGQMQQYDSGVGQQIGQIGSDLNQQINSADMQQQQTLMDMRNQALQQQMWKKANTPGVFDYLGAGLGLVANIF